MTDRVARPRPCAAAGSGLPLELQRDGVAHPHHFGLSEAARLGAGVRRRVPVQQITRPMALDPIAQREEAGVDGIFWIVVDAPGRGMAHEDVRAPEGRAPASRPLAACIGADRPDSARTPRSRRSSTRPPRPAPNEGLESPAASAHARRRDCRARRGGCGRPIRARRSKPAPGRRALGPRLGHCWRPARPRPAEAARRRGLGPAPNAPSSDRPDGSEPG
jgi:hypothetical protein